MMCERVVNPTLLSLAMTGFLCVGTTVAAAADSTSASASAPRSASVSASGSVSAADYQAAYAKAQQTANQAQSMHGAWTVTGDALKKAKQAAQEQQFDQAAQWARRADALAQASIRQAKEQRTSWHEAVVK